MTIEELIDALKKAEGPDRWLDWEIQKLCFKNDTFMPFNYFPDEWMTNIGGGMCPVTRYGKTMSTGDRYCPLYTALVDRAIMLAQQALPDANCYGFEKDERGIEAHVQRNGVKEGHWSQFAEHATSPAIALCIAVLKAKQKKDTAA